MNGKCTFGMVKTNYYAFYSQCIAPLIMAVDVSLKTMEAPMPLSEAAGLLQLTEEGLRRVMSDCSVKCLDKAGFLTVMGHADSFVCGLYRRERSRGMKALYDPSDIAYIYGLHNDTVNAACKQLGCAQIPADLVPCVLERVSIFILA